MSKKRNEEEEMAPITDSSLLAVWEALEKATSSKGESNYKGLEKTLILMQKWSVSKKSVTMVIRKGLFPRLLKAYDSLLLQDLGRTEVLKCILEMLYLIEDMSEHEEGKIEGGKHFLPRFFSLVLAKVASVRLQRAAVETLCALITRSPQNQDIALHKEEVWNKLITVVMPHCGDFQLQATIVEIFHRLSRKKPQLLDMIKDTALRERLHTINQMKNPNLLVEIRDIVNTLNQSNGESRSVYSFSAEKVILDGCNEPFIEDAWVHFGNAHISFDGAQELAKLLIKTDIVGSDHVDVPYGEIKEIKKISACTMKVLIRSPSNCMLLKEEIENFPKNITIIFVFKQEDLHVILSYIYPRIGRSPKTMSCKVRSNEGNSQQTTSANTSMYSTTNFCKASVGFTVPLPKRLKFTTLFKEGSGPCSSEYIPPQDYENPSNTPGFRNSIEKQRKEADYLNMSEVDLLRLFSPKQGQKKNPKSPSKILSEVDLCRVSSPKQIQKNISKIPPYILCEVDPHTVSLPKQAQNNIPKSPPHILSEVDLRRVSSPKKVPNVIPKSPQNTLSEVDLRRVSSPKQAQFFTPKSVQSLFSEVDPRRVSSPKQGEKSIPRSPNRLNEVDLCTVLLPPKQEQKNTLKSPPRILSEGDFSPVFSPKQVRNNIPKGPLNILSEVEFCPVFLPKQTQKNAPKSSPTKKLSEIELGTLFPPKKTQNNPLKSPPNRSSEMELGTVFSSKQVEKNVPRSPVEMECLQDPEKEIEKVERRQPKPTTVDRNAVFAPQNLTEEVAQKIPFSHHQAKKSEKTKHLDKLCPRKPKYETRKALLNNPKTFDFYGRRNSSNTQKLNSKSEEREEASKRRVSCKEKVNIEERDDPFGFLSGEQSEKRVEKGYERKRVTSSDLEGGRIGRRVVVSANKEGTSAEKTEQVKKPLSFGGNRQINGNPASLKHEGLELSSLEEREKSGKGKASTWVHFSGCVPNGKEKVPDRKEKVGVSDPIETDSELNTSLKHRKGEEMEWSFEGHTFPPAKTRKSRELDTPVGLNAKAKAPPLPSTLENQTPKRKFKVFIAEQDRDLGGEFTNIEENVEAMETGNRKKPDQPPQTESIILLDDTMNPDKAPQTENTVLSDDAMKFHLTDDLGMKGQIIMVASLLQKFGKKARMVARTKMLEVLSETSEKIQHKLQEIDTQMKSDVDKHAHLCRKKVGQLEDQLKDVHNKVKELHESFKRDCACHLKHYGQILSQVKSTENELRDMAHKQNLAHRKLFAKTQEFVEQQLAEGEEKMSSVQKAAKEMWGLRNVFEDVVQNV